KIIMKKITHLTNNEFSFLTPKKKKYIYIYIYIYIYTNNELPNSHTYVLTQNLLPWFREVTEFDIVSTP
ncbi:hypothetical protein ACMBCM_10470, partial [Spiroplasma sp. K1]